MIEESVAQIDENAQSRQLAVYGHEAQAKLMAMRVFIHGINGLGIEVAKNLILAGPKQVTIYDPTIVEVADVGRNFYVKQEHIGKMTRAGASLKSLRELNQNTVVNEAENDKIESIIADHNCVVVLDSYNRDYLVQLNKACREKGIGFIYGGNLGLYGFTFVDFGDKHKVIDTTGEQEKSIFISLITNEPEGVVLLHEGKKHGFSDGDTVVFKEVQGMTELNGMAFKIKVLSPDSFSIGDTTKFGEYDTGGIATEVKVPVFQDFYSLERSLSYPYAPGTKEMPICNWQNFGQPQQFHVILNGLLNFYAKNQRLPRNLDQEDVAELAQLCKNWQQTKICEQGFQFKVNEIESKLITTVSKFSGTQISPICSFWGGIITQQIIKLNGKYSPLRQWLHHSFCQVITPQNHIYSPQKPVLSYLNTRYADYDIIFGDKFVEDVGQNTIFLIGAGALGCEFVKMFGLMGFSTSEKSKIVVTDDDNIEISNLNRQFLFRKKHVGRNKSQVACHIGKKLNKACKFESLKLKVCPDTESVFNDEFWENTDLVVNAVDNVKARQFIDNKCVWYEKPFFESGTLGTKCHTQIIIPHHTLSYNDIIDPPEEEFAVCTLKLFPYQIEHTIQWAREYFETVIAIPSQDLKNFYENKEFLHKLVKENKKNPFVTKDRLTRMKRLHEINQSQSYQKCVETAVRSFEEAFQNQIGQLLHAFPEDYIHPETGKPYWSGLKRTPKIIKLNGEDKLHLEFIQAMSNILAQAFKLPQEKDEQRIKQLIKQIKPVEFSPKKTKLKVDESKSDNSALEEEPCEQDEQQVFELVESLEGIQTDKFKAPTVVAFEKDDPTNWHIEFMGGVSNLRARNYHIEEVDNFKVKLIAGKIIPAIATATALIVGAVGIEIIKYLVQKNVKEYKEGFFKNVTVNLALPLFIFNDPLLPIENTDKQFDMIMGDKVRAITGKYTKWDKLTFRGPLTVEQLKNQFEQQYSIKIDVIACEGTNIFTSYGPDAKASKERLQLKIEAAWEQVTKKKISSGKKALNVQISNSSDKEGVFCLIPEIRYVL